jgi:hypothetical protein
MTKYAAALFAPLFLFVCMASAHAGGVNGTLSITVSPSALVLILNPSSIVEACSVPAGTIISTSSTLGGDGNAITYSMTGNTTDFVINSSTGVITVAARGILAPDCNKSYTNVVTATQP